MTQEDEPKRATLHHVCLPFSPVKWMFLLWRLSDEGHCLYHYTGN